MRTPHTVLAEKWAAENARIAGRRTGKVRRRLAPSAVEQATTRDGRLVRLESRYPVIVTRPVSWLGPVRSGTHPRTKGARCFTGGHRRRLASTRGVSGWLG